MATELSIENLEEVYNIVGVLPSDGHGALVARLAEIWELFVKNEEQIISEDEERDISEDQLRSDLYYLIANRKYLIDNWSDARTIEEVWKTIHGAIDLIETLIKERGERVMTNKLKRGVKH
jgi:hypothetical protein